MILSMTGYGSAQGVDDGTNYAVELRALNHRYFKLSIKLPEHLQFTEPAIEKLLRRRINRGSVACVVRTRGESAVGAGQINAAALTHYLQQLAGVKLPKGMQADLDLATMALLPGVCEPPSGDEAKQERQQKTVLDLLGQAIDTLVAMRRTEGEVLRNDLQSIASSIRGELENVKSRAPAVVEEYHERLRTRVTMLMEKGGFELQQDGLMREVAVFAERCDISEEVVRLAAHLDQVDELCNSDQPVGRTLDFLTQELLREANTIGSKSNDAGIARGVVTMKGLIDRMKEQVQNVE